MNKLIIISFFICQSINQTYAQDPHWAYVDFPFTRTDANLQCYEDTVDNVGYLIGNYYLTVEDTTDTLEGNVNHRALATFDGNIFEVIGYFCNSLYDVVRYDGYIYAGGTFTCMHNNNNINYIGRYNGEIWEPVGDFNNRVRTMATDGNYLYVAGGFTEIDGQPFNKIARYNGTQWESIPAGDFDPSSLIQKLLFYQGELYVGGRIYLDNEQEDDYSVRVMRNDSWEPLDNDPYLTGMVRHMAEWNEELYLAGDFYGDNNNLHQAIVKWDGEELTAPWPSFYFIDNQIGWGSTVLRLAATSDHLYASGHMEYMGSEEVNQMAAYDGNQWCSMYTEGLQASLFGMFSFRDTVYAFQQLNPYSATLYPSGLYKWIGGDDFENCTPGTTDIDVQVEDQLKVYPNPVLDYVTVYNTNSKDGEATLISPTGTIAVARKWINRGGSQVYDLSGLAAGIYLLRLNLSDGSIMTTKLIKL